MTHGYLCLILLVLLMVSCTSRPAENRVVPVAEAAGKPMAETDKPKEFTGELEPELVSLRGEYETSFLLATSQRRKKLPSLAPEAPKDARVYFGYSEELRVRLYLVQPAEGPVFLCADLDSDDVIGEAERFEFSPDPEKKIQQVVGKFPIPGRYKHRSVRLFYKEGAFGEGSQAVKLNLTGYNYAKGKVDIGGRQVEVWYHLNLQTGQVELRKSFIGMDCNGDGKIDRSYLSPEYVDTYDETDEHETVVFRFGDRYFSTSSVDTETGKIVLREHPASDYQRIEVKVGNKFPDFSFVDFAGKTRKLSEFRGKYLLMDFWGAW